MTDPQIAGVQVWEALDSRGRPTVACQLRLSDGATGTVTVPSGASTGRHEARELRDGGDRFDGWGTRRAVRSAEELSRALIGRDPADQAGIDALLTDGDDPQLSGRGSNAVLALSVAVAVSVAASRRQPLWQLLAADPAAPPLLPRPMVNILSGGAHAGRALDIQDVLAVPLTAATFAEALEQCSRVRAGTAEELRAQGHPTSLVADEGGLAAALPSNRAALDVVHRGIERAGLRPGADVGLAVDLAATQFHHDGGYRFAIEQRLLSAGDLLEEVLGWCDRFPVVSIEDPFAEDDWEAWRQLRPRLPASTQLLGDDLLATSRQRLDAAIAANAATAVLVKPNQAGTLTRAREVTRAAQAAGWRTVVSARSGDTEDTWLADLAVGWRAGQIKVGSTTRSERTAKWNRLLQIHATRSDAALADWALPLAAPQEEHL